ncbi:MAG: cytochrome c biogenesis CcdA family protein [Acidimicrobiales bacterium]
MEDILFGSAVIAAFVGGAVALFAPCCISVMLPAYFATTFRRRRALVAMTFVFALGVATVILPIALGASVVTRFIIGRHTIVFFVGAVLMVGLGLAMLTGWKLPLPMPGMGARSDRGAGSVYALGVFSGTASACCAPVLAGVVALSGAAGSFLAATVVGVAYVFGMVVPLFLIAAAWDRYDWGERALLRGRTFNFRLLGRTRSVHSTNLAGGLLLMIMGVLTAVLAFNGPNMARKGWQVELTSRLQHWGKVLVSRVDAFPGWVSAIAVFAVLGLLVRIAVRQYLDGAADPATAHQPALVPEGATRPVPSCSAWETWPPAAGDHDDEPVADSVETPKPGSLLQATGSDTTAHQGGQP